MNNKFEIQSTMDQLDKLGLLKEDLDVEEFEDALARDTDELTRLLELVDDNDYVKNMKFNELVKLPFAEAQKTIERMDMAKRIAMLDELTTLRKFYYEETKRYCGVSKDELISASEFRSLLGKIKHLEILQNWLYGIA